MINDSDLRSAVAARSHRRAPQRHTAELDVPEWYFMVIVRFLRESFVLEATQQSASHGGLYLCFGVLFQLFFSGGCTNERRSSCVWAPLGLHYCGIYATAALMICINQQLITGRNVFD